MSETILQLDGVHTDIAQYHILHDVSLAVPEGGVHVLLGRNGAGKTTTLRTVMGLWQARAGSVRFRGQDITRLHTSDIARLGIAYVPENMGIFGGLTVEENMRLATTGGRFEQDRLDWIYRLFPALQTFWTKSAWALSGGQKQMLAIARAIVEKRDLILIDEPTKGLAPAIILNMIEAFREVATETTILLVEQNFLFARSLGETVAVIDDGHIVHAGSMAELANDQELQTRLLSLSLDAHQQTRFAMKQLSSAIERFGGVTLLPLLLAIIALALIGSVSTWITLTAAGLAMGMMIFLMASGLSLVFGLMDVLNFGHSAFVSFGAFVAASVLSALAFWVDSDNIALNVLALLLAIGAAALFGLLVGWFFEQVIIKPVYRDHLRQILITMGALIVAEQIILAVWGGSPIAVARPRFLAGSLIFGDVSIEIYRIFAFGLGLIAFIALYLVLNRTRVGLLVRAGVENREMVEALGFRIDRLFVGVFVVGSALAAVGGAMWAGYQTLITPEIGSQMMIIVFIVIIIGGLGSIEGSLLGAVMVGLMDNYVAFLAPKLALASSMILMMAILLWRPYGLRPAVK